MSLDTIVKNIQNTLVQNNFLEYSEEINNCIRKGSTGSEITSIVGNYLIGLKKKNEAAYQLISKEVDEYIEISKDIGLDIT